MNRAAVSIRPRPGTRYALAIAAALFAASLSGVGYAQPAPKRIGWVAQGNAQTKGDPALVDFRQGMTDRRYVEGRDYVIEVRYANGRTEQLPQLAGDLAKQRVDVIVTSGEAAAQAAKRATATIPIVAIEFGSDPVKAKLVASLGRPEANLTGVVSRSDDLWPKRLDYLKDIAPKGPRIAVLWNPDNPGNRECVEAIRVAGSARGMQTRELEARDRAALDRAFATLTREPVDALACCWDDVTLEHARSIATFARERRLPTLFPVAEYVQAGGLVSYGPDLPMHRRKGAEYVDRLFKGAKPSALPMEQDTPYLVMNQGTAKALGLTLPPALLLQAEEVVP